MFYSTANGFIGSPIGAILYRRDTEADIENAETVDIVAKAAGSLKCRQQAANNVSADVRTMNVLMSSRRM